MGLEFHASDLQSGAWIKLREYYEAKLADLRKQNDALNMDEKTRSYLVGRIQEIKELLGHDPKAST